MQVYGKGNFFTGQGVERMGNVVSGGTAGTTGVVTLNENEFTLKNFSAKLWWAPWMSALYYNTHGPLMLTNCSASTIRLQVKSKKSI